MKEKNLKANVQGQPAESGAADRKENNKGELKTDSDTQRDSAWSAPSCSADSDHQTGLNRGATPLNRQIYNIEFSNEKYGTNPQGKTWNECLKEKAFKDLETYFNALSNEKPPSKGLRITMSVDRLEGDPHESHLENSEQKHQGQCSRQDQSEQPYYQGFFGGLRDLLSKLKCRFQTGSHLHQGGFGR